MKRLIAGKCKWSFDHSCPTFLSIKSFIRSLLITGPPNRPVLFCTLSSVSVCNARGRSADAGRVAGPAADSPTLTAGQSCYVPLGPV